MVNLGQHNVLSLVGGAFLDAGIQVAGAAEIAVPSLPLRASDQNGVDGRSFGKSELQSWWSHGSQRARRADQLAQGGVYSSEIVQSIDVVACHGAMRGVVAS